MIFRKCKKLTAVALSAALMVSAVSMSASAISLDSVYDAPSAKAAAVSDVNANYACLSGSTAAANTTLLSILGINVTSTDAAGVYNSAGTNGQSTPINLQIFGSDWNSSPDPYYYTFYYNFANDTITPDGTTVGDCTDTSVYSSWTGDYTLIYAANKSGPSGAASSLFSLKVNGYDEVANTNPAFYYQPDVLFSGATLSDVTDATSYSTTAYSTALASYQSYNPDYDPLIVGGWNTSQYCANASANGFSNIESMAEGIQAIASAIESNTSKSGRYGDISDIADQLYAFSVGVHDYATANGCTSAVYCFSPTYDEDAGTVTVKAVSGRYAQYLDGIGVDYYTTLSSYTMDLGDFTKAVLNDGIVIFDAPDGLEEDMEAYAEEYSLTGNISCIPLPTTVYGMTMQSADNMLGTAYCFGALYGSGSIPTYLDMLAYWVTYFYHVNSTNLNNAMSLMLDETITSSDYHSTTFTSLVNTISGYTES